MIILVSANSEWNLVNYRMGLLRELLAAGHQIYTVAPRSLHTPQLVAIGCQCIPIPISSQGMNIFCELQLLIRYICIFAKFKPDLFLGFTIKPNIYGSIGAYICGVKIINTITGLGSAFTGGGFNAKIVKFLYRIGLANSDLIFFQNTDDASLFLNEKIINADVVRIVPGSGIDLNRFKLKHEGHQVKTAPLSFLMIARLLIDKGVLDFVKAAEIIKNNNPDVNFFLLGSFEPSSPSAIHEVEVKKWVDAALINYLGFMEDVREILSASSCIVLPSYREGVPRSLLEAGAIGIPIIATDVPGCRDVVDDGLNGFLCKPRNYIDLAEKMQLIIDLSDEDRLRMGCRGRLKVERQFDEKVVIKYYQSAILDLSKD